MGFVELVVGGALAERLMYRSYGEKGVKDRMGGAGAGGLSAVNWGCKQANPDEV